MYLILKYSRLLKTLSVIPLLQIDESNKITSSPA